MRTTFGTALGLAAVALGLGCGGSAAVPPPDVGRIPLYVGVWRVAGSAVVTCPDSTRISPLRDTVTISAGVVSALTVDFDCPVRFDLVAATDAVAIDPGQACTFGDETIQYGAWTLNTADGVTGSWMSSGTAFALLPLGMEICALNSQAVLTR
jgi:hypothetical protein